MDNSFRWGLLQLVTSSAGYIHNHLTHSQIPVRSTNSPPIFSKCLALQGGYLLRILLPNERY